MSGHASSPTRGPCTGCHTWCAARSWGQCLLVLQVGHREPTPTEVRRSELDAAVRAAFEASKRTYGSPRIHADLVEAGGTVSVNTVADSMRRQGLQGRKPKRRRGTTKQDKTAPKFPNRRQRDFTAPEPNVKWCGDMTEIRPTRQALPRYRPGSVLPQVAGQPDRGAPGCGAGRRCDQDGRRGARRSHRDRGGDLPHRSRIHLHGKGFHEIVRPARGGAVDGQGRFVFR